jgi:superfamily I DNA/RNA helicase
MEQALKRAGRSQPLGESGRRLCLDAIRHWDKQLNASHTLDYPGIVQAAWDLVTQRGAASTVVKDSFALHPRCVLVDEVQDLSQIELRMLGQLRTPDDESLASTANGLFLVGDGAQTIYKRGFSLSRMGINVAGRSWVLKKNYRNTFEILKAAYGLIEDYEFADIDEDNCQKPLKPDYATRHGQRPFAIKCRSLVEEADCIVKQIETLIADEHPPGQICVVGPNFAVREAVVQGLRQAGIAWAELREDADAENDKIKISTIESAKGHEFRTVFIGGLVEGVLPQRNTPPEDLPREAARLYVAMTRARDNLYLSYTVNPNYRPSRFPCPPVIPCRCRSSSLQKRP